MVDTIENIVVGRESWIDIYSSSILDPQTPITIQNIGATDLYVSVLTKKPHVDHDAYKIFSRGDEISFFNDEWFIWVFSPQSNGLINVEPLKKDSSGNDNFLNLLAKSNSEIIDQNHKIITQLKLLNLRFEEVFESGIDETLEGES